MVVKENQIQRNATGFTMKTHKDNIPSWTHDINEWFVSLDHKVSENPSMKDKDISYRIP